MLNLLFKVIKKYIENNNKTNFKTTLMNFPRPHVHQVFQATRLRIYNNQVFVGIQMGFHTVWLRRDIFNATLRKMQECVRLNNIAALTVVENVASPFYAQFGCFRFLTFSWLEIRENAFNTFLVRACDDLTVFF